MARTGERSQRPIAAALAAHDPEADLIGPENPEDVAPFDNVLRALEPRTLTRSKETDAMTHETENPQGDAASSDAGEDVAATVDADDSATASDDGSVEVHRETTVEDKRLGGPREGDAGE